MAMYPTPSQTQDRTLWRRVRSTLLQQGLAQGVTLTVHEGQVILRGVVPDQRIRRQLLDCCRHIAGVLNVIDKMTLASARSSVSRPQVVS
jgi:osmotically-inducible protein OsmY